MATRSRHQLISERPPVDNHVTDYDYAHLKIYLRLLDAEADHAPWAEVAHIVLGLDPTMNPERAHEIYESHLARAKWMSEQGYRDLLRDSDR